MIYKIVIYSACSSAPYISLVYFSASSAVQRPSVFKPQVCGIVFAIKWLVNRFKFIGLRTPRNLRIWLHKYARHSAFDPGMQIPRCSSNLLSYVPIPATLKSLLMRNCLWKVAQSHRSPKPNSDAKLCLFLALLSV